MTAPVAMNPTDRLSGLRRAKRALAFIAPLLALAVVWLGMFAFAPGFGAWDNQRLILTQAAIVAAAAIGATIVIIAGGIDLSVGSAVALVTMFIALLLNRGAGPLVAVLGGIAAGGVVGLLIGGLVVGWVLPRLPLSPFIVTLALWGALRGVAKGIGGNQPIYVSESAGESNMGWLPWLMNGSDSGLLHEIVPAVWLVAACGLAVTLVLNRTILGRRAFAIGGNEHAARICGVPVPATKFMLYGLAGLCTGLAGVLQFSFVPQGDPTAAQGLELKVIAAVVIGGASLSGGAGSVLGTLAGILIMTIVDNGCTKLRLDNWVQEIVTGGIILIAVAVDRLRLRAQRAGTS